MSQVKRKLATILATDCVGFSKHMESQEEKTLMNLNACRDIIDPLITNSKNMATCISAAESYMEKEI
mgnify:CR=1 FL=1